MNTQEIYVDLNIVSMDIVLKCSALANYKDKFNGDGDSAKDDPV